MLVRDIPGDDYILWLHGSSKETLAATEEELDRRGLLEDESDEDGAADRVAVRRDPLASTAPALL